MPHLVPLPEDIAWLRANLAVLDETLRQTRERQPERSNAIRVLQRMRDRTARILLVLTYEPPKVS